jgi:hypothetical protein
MGLRGRIQIDRYDLVNPQVQVYADAAVLTYNFVSVSEGRTNRWNCTEVYRRFDDGWRIIHTHWSVAQPFRQNQP